MTEVGGAAWEVGPGRVIDLAVGDITRIPADAIVNAANNELRGGAGVDGAIHKVGGPAIMADLTNRYGPIGVRSCPDGSAVISVAGELPARWVIHTVGPFWYGGNRGEAQALASAYATSLRLADEHGAEHVTFPAISTGVFRYPAFAAAEIAVTTVAAALREASCIRRVTLVAYGPPGLEPLEAAMGRVRAGS